MGEISPGVMLVALWFAWAVCKLLREWWDGELAGDDTGIYWDEG